MKIAEQKEFLLKMLEIQNYEALKEFIENGYDIDRKLNGAKQSLLYLAVEKNLYVLAEFLLLNGADVNALSFNGSTPISSVASLELAKLLVEKNANLNVIDKKDQSIIYYHIEQHQVEIIKYLIDRIGEVWEFSNLKDVEPMDENEFWSIIEEKYFGEGDENMHAIHILRELQHQDPPKIIAFEKKLYQLTSFAFTSNLWAAAYVIYGGCSDDSFEDFRYWLVHLGKKAFYECIAHPDHLIKYLNNRTNYYQKYAHIYKSNYYTKSLHGLASNAYTIRTGGLANFYEIIDYANIPSISKEQFIMDWDEDSIETKKSIFPKLWQTYWK